MTQLDERCEKGVRRYPRLPDDPAQRPAFDFAMERNDAPLAPSAKHDMAATLTDLDKPEPFERSDNLCARQNGIVRHSPEP